MFVDTKATTLDVSSFNTSSVTNMYGMFAGSQATALNLTNFDTSKVSKMDYMFASTQVTTLDLSNFDTSSVSNMSYMFNDSSKLKTIYASDMFVGDNLGESDSMFLGCTSLVGGAGTTYDEEYIDFTYAHIDGGTSNPGYFTAK